MKNLKEVRNKLKLPDIILAKMNPNKSVVPSEVVPGLKTIQTHKKLHTRNLSEIKAPQTDRSVDISAK